MGVIKFSVVILVGLAACGSEKVDQCDKDSDCTNIAYPFCDVSGQYAPSGGEMHVCTVTPADCPVDRCGCSPGATTCTGDQETTCNLDGKSTTATTCALGCAASKDHCLAFEPTNGLGPAMTAAASEPDVTFPASVHINTDTGVVTDAANAPVQVTTLLLANIRVYIAHSFAISNAIVTGSKPLAFVAPGSITMSGAISANAVATAGGPGAATSGDCVGAFAVVGGGGGNGTDGGTGRVGAAVGGPMTISGGVPQTEFVPLKGGCNGGGPAAGAGGGAVQFDSFDSITVASTGFVDVGGGGASGASDGYYGGGSGGTVILEAPKVVISGGITANGGAGSACGVSGPDGKRSVDVAVGPSCTIGAGGAHGGNGGTGAIAVGGGASSGTNDAGGGGAVGRMYVSTLDGTYSTGAGAVVSAATTTDALILK